MKAVKLGQVCQLHYGKALQGYQDNAPNESPVRVYGTNGPIGWTKTPLVEQPTIIVGRKGAYRGVHFSNRPSWTIDTAYFLTTTSSDIDIEWLYYRLLLLDINRMDSGAAIPSTKREDFYAAKVHIPSRDAQTRIASILSAYDDLIENNRRRIQLLEQAARLLYKEWFVRLRFPGHEHVTITDGLPEGWERKPLSEFCTDIRESINPKNVSPDATYIGLEHIPKRSITLNGWGTASEVDSSKLKFAEGDILFGKIRPYFHKVGFALMGGIVSSDAIVIRPSKDYLYYYVLFLLSSDEFVALASKTVREGSKMPRMDWKYLFRSQFKRPSPMQLRLFSEVAAPACNQLRILALHNQQLAQARDLLLPRLMNGQVAV